MLWLKRKRRHLSGTANFSVGLIPEHALTCTKCELENAYRSAVQTGPSKLEEVRRESQAMKVTSVVFGSEVYSRSYFDFNWSLMRGSCHGEFLDGLRDRHVLDTEY